MKARTILGAAVLLLAACAGPHSGDRSNLVVSRGSPDLVLRIDPAFRALPRIRFPIETLTDAERRTFVVADSAGSVARMIVVQFEKVQPGSEFRFLYPSTPPRSFGAEVYRAGAFAYDDEAAARTAPLREAGRTRRLLEAQGLRPPHYWKAARLARVSDPNGLSEVIIFYMESADRAFSAGRPATDEDGDIVLDAAERERLLRALEAAIRPVRG